jgi:hypothetical protein
MLPQGVGPISKDFGNTHACFDRRYRLAVSNSCDIPIKIHLDGGTGNYGSATGDQTLNGYGKRQVFTCLEALGHCNGLQLTVLGFEQNPHPSARQTNGDRTTVAWIKDGTERPNRYGGTDLYYIKDGLWYVMRTKTKPQAPDYVANERITFYVDLAAHWYVVASSGEKWFVNPGSPD